MNFAEKILLKDLRQAGKILLLFFSALAILIFIIHGLIVLGFKYPLDYGEGPLLNQALRITQGEPLYPTDITSPPYLITNYPPIFVAINALFVWIFGPSLLIGRLIAFLSTLGTAILILYIINHFYPDQGLFPGIFAASLFLIIPYVLEWSSLFRIDMLALFFSLAGVFIVIGRPEDKKTILLGAIFFVLAAYTRQSFGLAGPLATALYIWKRNRRQAIKMILIYAIAGLAIFGLLQIATQGGFFFHIVKANINPFRWETVLNYVRDLWDKMPWLITILVIYLGLGWRNFPMFWFLAPYLVVSAVTAVTIGKVGSNVNYLVEISAALAILAGIVLGKFWDLLPLDQDKLPKLDFPKNKMPNIESIDPQIRKKMWINLVIFLAFSAILIIQLTGLTQDSLLGPIMNHRERIKMGRSYIILEKSVINASTKGNVLSDEYMAVLPDNKIPLYIQPFELTQLANAKIWDQSDFIAAINQQSFPLILIHHFPFYPVYLERWTDEMLTTIYENYVANNFRANSLFFEPKDVNLEVYPINRRCPDTPWQIPTEGQMGLFWYNRQLLLMGSGYSGEIPVYAIADGLLYQFPGWETSVAIRHEDPFDAGKIIWSFYGDLAPAFNAENSFIEDRFVGAQGEPVSAGELIGYQGNWLGSEHQTWVHLRFALLPADADGGFPEALKPINDIYAPLPSLQEQVSLGLDVPISLTTYTGLPQSKIFGDFVFLPYQCEQKGNE